MNIRKLFRKQTGDCIRPAARAVLGMLILAAMFFAPLIQAQSGTGAIQGTVKDSQGAVIPGVTIQVLNKNTGQTSNTRTNETGFYSVPGVFAGQYTVTFTAEGMGKYEAGVSLQVAQTEVLSPTLTPGTVTQQVNVATDTVQLATYDNGTISSQLDNTRINQLPMNGRNILTLAGLTTPGLEAGGTRANGNLAAAIEYVQDGAPLANRNQGGPTTQPDPDSVQEVKIETVNSNARYAAPATAILTTKSGTNQLHGSFFETVRNNAIGVAKARQDPFNLVAPHLVRNEFGASVGGPILLPRIYDGRNRSFFFVAYERFSNRQAINNLVTVPTQAMRNGDFSGLVNGNNQLQVLYDNATTDPITFQRKPFANNQIPLARISPLAKTLYAITPLPAGPNAQANPLVSSNLTAAGINNTTRPTITFRLDHTLNDSNRMYLRYTSSHSEATTLRNYPNNQTDTIAGAGFPAGVTNENRVPITVFSASLGFTHIFSPTLFSETVIGNQWEKDATLGGGNPLTNYESILGLPNNFGQSGFPQIGGNLLTNYSGTQFNFIGSQIITNIDENLIKTVGRHQIFFGGRYRHERLGALPDRTPDQVNFSNQATALIDPASGASYNSLANTGNQNADFFLGAASSYIQRLNPPFEHFRNQEFDAYVQDDFHIIPNLTINAGLRWEAHPAATERNNVFNGFDFDNKAVVLGRSIADFISLGYTTQTIVTNLQNLGVKFESASEANFPQHLVNSYNWNFSPRVGFAYSPFGSGRGTVIRSGFGRFVYPIPIRNFYASGKLNAPFAAAYTQSYTAANQSPDGQPNYLLRAPQTVVAGQNSAGVVDSSTINSILPGGPTEFVLNPRYPPNFVTQFNLTVEQPVRGSSVVRVSYLWNHGSNLDQQNNRNQTLSAYVWEVTTGTLPPTGPYSGVALNPYDNRTFSAITSQDRTGWSNDNALQVNYQRLYKKGYAYQAFYVFSRAMRVGGNAFRDGNIFPYATYAPGAAPSSDPQTLNRFQNYQLDAAVPKHHISFNGIVDLPIGKGKRFLGNSGRFVNALVGGFQIAGDGNVVSQYFQPSAGNWGATNPLQLYKKKHKITDCSSGVCHPGYLWFNGFIAPQVQNAAVKGISGIPGGYLPYQSPINITPGDPNYLTNNVKVKLANQSIVTTSYNPGPAGVNPFSHTFLSGPFNWSADLSLFKVFAVTETSSVRLNVDAFNVFNVQGYTNPNSTTGVQTFLSSYNTPRQIQVSARFSF